MQDLREQFKDVPWQQGVLLNTQTVMRMPLEWRRESSEKEKRALFAHFSPFDEGRSRVCLWRFATSEECAAVVEQHNKELAERNKTPNL